mmetsp:Transcript_11626/g.18530  ORF Transcript_11626/g.18530 Transcript_11626/m.18530 type:complete len:576 (+) Transcript_11626:120-1847(+)
MRFCKSGYALLLLSVLAIAAAQPYVNKWTESSDGKSFTVVPGKAATCPAGTDMFPTKVKDVLAQFMVEYKDSYKIVTNKVAGTKYVLVQRGCEAPTGIAGVTATFTIPLTVVAASSSTYFPVFHYMGEKQAIRLYTTDVMYSFNGCMQKQAAAGYTLLDSTGYDASHEGGNFVTHTAYEARPTDDAGCKNCTCTGTTMTNTSGRVGCAGTSNCTCSRDSTLNPTLNALGIQATFGTGFSSYKNAVRISDTTEESFYTVGEWIEYIAVFFNKEKEVIDLADLSRERWDVESKGIKNQIGTTRPKVLLLEGYHTGLSYYFDGWMIPTCKKTNVCPDPNDWKAGGSEASLGIDMPVGTKCGAERWCQLVSDAGGEVMNGELPTTWTASQYGKGSKEGISHKDLITFAKDADIVILKSAMVTQAAMQTILDAMKGIKAVDDKKVFDMQRILYSAGTSWDGKAAVGNGAFEQGQIEPDILLQDVIKMVDPEYDHDMVFFRNVFTEGMGIDTLCKDKPDHVGCVQDPVELIKQCTNQTSRKDVLLYIPGGFMAALSNNAGRIALSAGSMLVLFAVSLGLMQ